jgi:hypothetical protein
MTIRIESGQPKAGPRRGAARLCCIQVLSSAKSKRPHRLYSGGENNFPIFSTGICRHFRSAAVRDEKKFFFSNFWISNAALPDFTLMKKKILMLYFRIFYDKSVTFLFQNIRNCSLRIFPFRKNPEVQPSEVFWCRFFFLNFYFIFQFTCGTWKIEKPEVQRSNGFFLRKI